MSYRAFQSCGVSVRMLCVVLYLIMLRIEYVVYCAAGGEGGEDEGWKRRRRVGASRRVF